jgi:undecaprenyl-diphosphatase
MHSLNRLSRLSFLPWLALMAGGVALLGLAVTYSAALPRLDGLAIDEFRDHSGLTAFTGLALAVSVIGSTQVALLVAGVAGAVLGALREWHGVLMVTLSAVAAQLTVQILKSVVARPRPGAEDQLVHAGGFSFPSGHSTTSMAVYATLTFLAVRAVSRGSHRAALVTAGTLLVIGIGVSRVFLGVHYPTDVIAGWLTGGLLVLGSWGLVRVLGLSRAGRVPEPTAA